MSRLGVMDSIMTAIGLPDIQFFNKNHFSLPIPDPKTPHEHVANLSAKGHTEGVVFHAKDNNLFVVCEDSHVFANWIYRVFGGVHPTIVHNWQEEPPQYADKLGLYVRNWRVVTADGIRGRILEARHNQNIIVSIQGAVT